MFFVQVNRTIDDRVQSETRVIVQVVIMHSESLGVATGKYKMWGVIFNNKKSSKENNNNNNFAY